MSATSQTSKGILTLIPSGTRLKNWQPVQPVPKKVLGVNVHDGKPFFDESGL